MSEYPCTACGISNRWEAPIAITRGVYLCFDCAELCLEIVNEHRLRTLGRNLAIGGALCASFALGKAYGAERVVAGWNGGGWTYPFEPGCRRSAP